MPRKPKHQTRKQVAKGRKGGDWSTTATTVGTAAYSQAATLGKITAIFKAIGGSLVAIIIGAIGIVLIRSKDTYTHKTLATVTKADCVTDTSNGSAHIRCALDVRFEHDGRQAYETTISAQGQHYIPGSTINIRYDPQNPKNAEEAHITKKTIGWVLLAAAIIILMAVWMVVIITWKSKLGAAAVGVGSAIDLVR
jgi:hypothetical protein